MGFLSALFKKNKIPVADIKKFYDLCYSSYAKDILEWLRKTGIAAGDSATVSVNINDITKLTCVMTEYALFLKAVFVFTIKTNMNSFSSDDAKELDKAFALLNDLVKPQCDIPSCKKIIEQRVDDYILSSQNNKIYGYSVQNYISPQYYGFIETLCKSDYSRFSLLFTDCVYHILRSGDFATSSDLERIKELASNETKSGASIYMKLCDEVYAQAQSISDEIKKILINH